MIEEGSPYLGDARGESDVSFCYRGEFKILRRRRQRKRQKGDTRRGEKKISLPAACRLFARGVIFTPARVSLALLSLRKNGGLLVVYCVPYLLQSCKTGTG